LAVLIGLCGLVAAVAHASADPWQYPPGTRITSGPTGAVDSSSVSFTFVGFRADGFQCRLDSTSPFAWSHCHSPKTYASLPDGPHTFEVRAVYSYHHHWWVDPTPAVASFVVDTQAPETTITAGPSGEIATGSASFEFTSSEEGSFECRLDSGEESAWAPCSSPQGYSSLADGPHTFEVRARDVVGNVDPTPAVASFVVDTGPPSPVAGVSIDAESIEGTVELECPGEDEYSRLASFEQIPVGCLVNTRNGVVNLTASKGQSGELQSSHFWGGLFLVSQEQGDNEPLHLKLTGRRMCERRTSKGRVAHRSRPGVRERRGRRGGGRRLWGSGKGNYTTSGSYGSATVRGTTWLVIDRCDASTLIRVTEGTVWATNFITHKLVVLTAGEEYLIKAPIPRLNPNLWH
jgi:hypothetical protein